MHCRQLKTFKVTCPQVSMTPVFDLREFLPHEAQILRLQTSTGLDLSIPVSSTACSAQQKLNQLFHEGLVAFGRPFQGAAAVSSWSFSSFAQRAQFQSKRIHSTIY